MADLVKRVMLKIVADDGDSEAKLDRITAKADELGAKHPELKVRIDTAAATAKVAVLRHELRALDDQGTTSRGLFSRLGGIFSGLGTAMTSPAAKITGIVTGIGLLGGAAVAAAAPLAAIVATVGSFAVFAVPELKKVETAITATGTAGKTAWAKLTPGERQLAGDMRQLTSMFHQVQRAIQPVVDKTLDLAVKLGQALLPALKVLAVAGGKVIDAFLRPFTQLVKSATFGQFVNELARFAVQAAKAFAPSLVSVLTSVLKLIVQLAPAGIKLDLALLKLTLAVVPLIAALAKLAGPIITGLLVPALNFLVTGPVTKLANAATWLEGHWTQAWASIVSYTKGAVAWVGTIPGRIVSFFAGLPGMLFSAGVNAISGLIHGLESKIPSVGSVASSIASKVAGFFGLSPAREGPLSAGGAPFIRGQHFAQDLAAGMRHASPSTAAAAAHLAGAMAAGTGTTGGAAGGGQRIVLEVAGGQSDFDQFLLTWIRKNVRIRGGNVQTAFGRP